MCEKCRRPIAAHGCGHHVPWPVERCRQKTCDLQPPCINKYIRQERGNSPDCETKHRNRDVLLSTIQDMNPKHRPDFNSQYAQHLPDDRSLAYDTSHYNQIALSPAEFMTSSTPSASSSLNISGKPLTEVLAAFIRSDSLEHMQPRSKHSGSRVEPHTITKAEAGVGMRRAYWTGPSRSKPSTQARIVRKALDEVLGAAPVSKRVLNISPRSQMNDASCLSWPLLERRSRNQHII